MNEKMPKRGGREEDILRGRQNEFSRIYKSFPLLPSPDLCFYQSCLLDKVGTIPS